MNLRAIGDNEPKVNKTKIKGIIQAWTNLDPVKAIQELRKHMTKEPYRYDKLFRILPIINTVDTNLDLIIAEVESQKGKIGIHETFRVTVEKRKTKLRSMEIIEKIAEIIDQKVDLSEPNWVVLIEIMGKTTGVSVIRPENIMNIQKERYLLSF
jgi:tRNA acetyltransferase TAN1